jgi:putative restriction endonuclease
MRLTTETTRPRIWVVLTFGEDRQHAGNSGYDDDPNKWYSYDSYVANHRQIADGDFLIICDRLRALGIAQIARLDSADSTRTLLRCPVCASTGIKSRHTKNPRYRCKRGHEFDEPVQVDADCTKYTAHFDDSFRPFADRFGRDFLRQGCPRYSDQLAMQEFDFSTMEAPFRSSFPEDAQLISDLISNPYIPAASAETGLLVEMPGYKLKESDDRELIFRQITARRGQQAFRDKLRARYGDRCMISGSRVLHVLEAAHISPYRNENDNHPENGLLLRADLHTLFDLDLVGIEPSTLKVCFNSTINSEEYKRLNGQVLTCCNGGQPNKQALLVRWQAFEKRAESGRMAVFPVEQVNGHKKAK